MNHLVFSLLCSLQCDNLITSFSLPVSLSLVKPMRHYTVFLSEDSSDDEFQQEEDPVSGFSENFFFSAPFEWSILYSFIVLIQSLNSGFCIDQGACSYICNFGNNLAIFVQHLMNVLHFSCLLSYLKACKNMLLHETLYSNAQFIALHSS